MSDAHGGHEGGEESGGGSNLFVDAIFWLLLFLVVLSTLKGVASSMNISFDFLPSPTAIFASIFGTVQVISVFVSLLFFIGIIYFKVKLNDMLHHGGHGHGDHGGHGGHDEHSDHGHLDDYDQTENAIAHFHGDAGHHVDKRWQNVLTRIESLSEGDWRLAIIEADIILEDMLTKMGYHGEGVGEKLKLAERSDFNTLDIAWEAHKVRNRIAHDGPAFHLSHDEARRVVGLFQKVFEEFYFI